MRARASGGGRFIHASRADGIIAAGPGRSAQRGFTLLEILLATALLAAGLALAFATLRAATATAQRGEALSQRSERVRAVEGFLRRRIASALPVGFATKPDTGEQIRFIGEPERMRFVADLPDYLGRGGPHLHDVQLLGDGDRARLAVSFTMVAGAQPQPERRPRPPETLAREIAQVRFRYRGLDADHQLGEWQDAWEAQAQLPLQVSIEILDADGTRWPTLVVALPQAGLDAGGGLFQ
ncbi:MAG TPA: prepilin-type N-terminal cleavage/methylation domain-containing protein [Luteimonas sp.]|nr:prepilin-type N-terminal cleavage/methylation domain-containing protein [Luteimonas sp.]